MKLVKEIISKSGKLHFRRWEIISTRWFSIYIHGIYAADEDLHLHNHPWNYCSIILKGSFVEEQKTKEGKIVFNQLRFLDCVTRNKKYYHKIRSLITPEVYTLFIVTKDTDEWGYDVDGKHIDYQTYRTIKNDFIQWKLKNS